MVGAARQSSGRSERTSFGIVDSRSVRNTGNAGSKGYDPGKKVSGIKRHKVLADEGYTRKTFAAEVQNLLGVSVEVVKRNELHTFAALPKRWVVERSFAWPEKCRRLWKNCERELNTSLQMVVLAFAVLMVLILKRL